MNTYLDKLRDVILKTNILDDEKEVALQQLGSIEKELTKLNFRLERALKEKNTLSTLLSHTSEDLEKSSELVKKMFGRYLSTEVMNSLLEDPSALELGGERRNVTIMLTDLRGFTALSERLKPEQVVQMLNSYFEVMVDVVLQYNGTINEITAGYFWSSARDVKPCSAGSRLCDRDAERDGKGKRAKPGFGPA